MYNYPNHHFNYLIPNTQYYCSYLPYTYQNTLPLQITICPVLNQPLILNFQKNEGELINNNNKPTLKKQEIEESITKNGIIQSINPKMEQNLQKKVSQSSKQINLNVRTKETKVQKSPMLYKNAYLSFLFNRILKFIQNRSQSQIWLKNLFKKNNIYDYSLIDQFYKYAFDESKRIINQVSIQKVKEFWIGRSCKQSPKGISPEKIQKFHLGFRVLTKVYLKDIYGVYILKSKKIKKQGIMNHLKMRRCLLKNLKHPRDFKSYKDF